MKGQANDEVMPAVPEAYVLVIATCEIVADDPGTYNGVLIVNKHVSGGRKNGKKELFT
jgi:hypothetical protein